MNMGVSKEQECCEGSLLRSLMAQVTLNVHLTAMPSSWSQVCFADHVQLTEHVHVVLKGEGLAC